MQILFSNKGLLAARIGEAGTEDFCRQLLSISERGGQSLVLEERTPEMQSQASSLRNTAINLSEVSLLICWYNLSSGLTVSLVIKLHCLSVHPKGAKFEGTAEEPRPAHSCTSQLICQQYPISWLYIEVRLVVMQLPSCSIPQTHPCIPLQLPQ